MKQKKRIRILSIILIVVGAACIVLGGLSKLGVIHVLPSAAPKVYDWSEMDLSKDHASESESEPTEPEGEVAPENEETTAEESSEESSENDASAAAPAEPAAEEGGTTNEP